MWNSTCNKRKAPRQDGGSHDLACELGREVDRRAQSIMTAGSSCRHQDQAPGSLLGKLRGVSLVEVVIAVFLTTVGIMAMMSMQPSAWRAAAKADYIGRAAEILSKELETRHAQILNPCNAVNLGTTTNTAVRASGQSTTVSGDAVYSVTTTITNIGTNIFRVTATVNWNNNANSITESLVVTRQDFFRFPTGCANA